MAANGKAEPERLEADWHRARLIPTSGIGGQDEQEKRATSSLLAVMMAVPEFGRSLINGLGAPAGKITTYAEVRFKVDDEKFVIPDGAIVVERGKTKWVCLVEVKTGNMPLRAEQVIQYVDVARTADIQAVVTISNQITQSVTDSPIAVEARRLKKVGLYHLSWWHILTEAITQHRHRGVSDPDQAWVLDELIHYLAHPASGAGGFEDMGDKWVAVRDAARAQTLRATDAGVKDVVQRWEQFIQWVALGLRQELGSAVVAVWPAKVDPATRLMDAAKELAATGRLRGTIRVPEAAAPMSIEVDLRTRQVTASIDIAAPKEGKAKTRLNWLLRQLKDAPPAVRVDVSFMGSRETTSEQLRIAREKPERLLLASDPNREPRSFRVALSGEMGAKRGKGRGSFVHNAQTEVQEFYRLVVQQLKVWAPPAPKLPPPADIEPDATLAEAAEATSATETGEVAD